MQAGSRVIFNYVRAQAEAERLAMECGADLCHTVQADLNGTAAAESLVRAAVERFGGLDILVANHGIWPPKDAPVDEMSDAQWRGTVAVNLDSYFTDGNGDPLTFTPNLAGLPAWVSYDPASHVLSGTPPIDNAGPVVVPLTVDDGRGGVIRVTVTLAPVNPGPHVVT